jgi:hypothetical protein
LVSVLLGVAVSGLGLFRLVHGDHPKAAPSTTVAASAPVVATASPTAHAQTTHASAAAATTTPASAPPARTTPTTAPATKTCSNTLVGYSVDYPASWSVAGMDPAGPCQFFNPTPFKVPADSEVAVAIDVYQMPDSFDTSTGQFAEGGMFHVLESEPLTIAGHRALRTSYLDENQTGAAGAENYEVAVEHDTHTLILTAHAPFSTDFAATRRVLDAMASSLRFTN